MIYCDCQKTRRLHLAYFEVVYCVGICDKEQVKRFSSEQTQEMLDFFTQKVNELRTIPFSNVRWYVADKKGYMNCFGAWYWRENNPAGESIIRYKLEDL